MKKVVLFGIGFILTLLQYKVIAQALITSSGVNNAFSVIFPANLISGVKPGMEVTFFSNQDISGSSTLQLNGGLAIPIVKNVNQALQSGDIVSGQSVSVIYDGNNWQMLSTSANVPTTNIWTVSGINIFPTNTTLSVSIGSINSGKVSGSSTYLSLVAAESYGGTKIPSFELQGSSSFVNGVIGKIDFVNYSNFSPVLRNIARIEVQQTNSASQGQMLFYTNSGTLTSPGASMFIGSSGNVGIGSTVPGFIAGSQKYLSLSAAEAYGSAAEASLEIKGTSLSGNGPIGKVDFAMVYPSTTSSIGRIESLRGNNIGDGSLTFSIGNSSTLLLSEAMRIASSGNVGIGTSNPLNTIHINGGARISSLSVGGTVFSNSNGDLYVGSIGGILGNGTSGGVTFWKNSSTITADGSNFFWDSSNKRLGIGTSVPLNSLDIKGAGVIGLDYAGVYSAPSNGLLIEGNLGVGQPSPNYKIHVLGSNPSIAIEESASSNSNLIFRRGGLDKWYLLENYQTPTDNIAFYDGVGGAGKVFQINPGGNIGVGTVPGTDMITVKGTGLFGNDIYLNANSGNQRATIHYGANGLLGQTISFYPDNGQATGLWIEGSNDGESGGIFMNGNTMSLWSPGDYDILRVYDEDVLPSGIPSFVINGSGNIGIGIASPAYKLDMGGILNLNSGIASGQALMVNGAEALWFNGTYYSWGYGGSANYFSDPVGLGITTPNGQLSVQTPSYNYAITMQQVGNSANFWYEGVRSSDAYKFHGYNGTFKGAFSIVDGTYSAASDKRLKKNIEELGGVLKDILKLHPSRYHMQQQTDSELKRIGFIAQELKEYFPEFVEYNKEENIYSINYSNMVVIALKAIQEQQKLIEGLQERIIKLEGSK